ncbi:MAG: hypothetical protein LBT48_01740 [Prevotellaceae bacterium]|jgi:hypothetical protein|nr:hypothetical protein [Prevotellaceae bacterium]
MKTNYDITLFGQGSTLSERSHRAACGEQGVGGIGVYAGKFSIRYENDGYPFGGWLGDGGDAYRTAAVQIGWGDYSIGVNLYTGNYASRKSIEGRDGITEEGVYYPNGYYKGGNVDDYRMGALYVGYKSYRAGVNSEWVRHYAQNIFAHNALKPQPGFLFVNLNKNKDWNPYFSYKSRNPYSLW